MSSRRSALWSLLVVLVGVVLLALPGKASAQELRPGKIVGQVVDASGAAVVGATVVLRHGDYVVARTVTGRDGRFEFAPVRPGRYVIGAEKAGVGRGREPAAVLPGTVTRVKITLKRV